MSECKLDLSEATLAELQKMLIHKDKQLALLNETLKDANYNYQSALATSIHEGSIPESEVWLRCYTALLTLEEQIQVTATYADDALGEYKKRYGDET